MHLLSYKSYFKSFLIDIGVFYITFLRIYLNIPVEIWVNVNGDFNGFKTSL